VDDFGDHNPITHIELLDQLAQAFQEAQFRPRELVRWICNAEAYGLSSIPNHANDKAAAEPYFSRALLRPLTPEQLFESLMTATQADGGPTSEAKKRLRDEWLRALTVNFGDDEGNEASFNGTVLQALMLMNGTEMNSALSQKDRGPVLSALKKHGIAVKAVIEDLYLAALNRRPTQSEVQELSKRLPMRIRDKEPTAPFDDILWALLNSSEFLLNH
jgi:hypothetical protein